MPSSLTQPQMASSALKSGLYPGRFTSRSLPVRASPSASSGQMQVLRNASPRWADALSQITYTGPAYLCRNCSKNAAEVPALLFPSSSIHSTSPVSRNTTE